MKKFRVAAHLALGASLISGGAAYAADTHTPSGGGTITNNTGDPYVENPGGSVAIGPTAGDVITLEGLNQFSGTASTIDLGGQFPANTGYSVLVHGSRLRTSGSIGTTAYGISAQTSAGNILIDTTGGAANTFNGSSAIRAITQSGAITIRTGADIIEITSGGSNNNANIIATATGNIAIDAQGTTISDPTSIGVGIRATSSAGQVAIGGASGGFTGRINAGLTGIVASGTGNGNTVTIGSGGSVTGTRVGISLNGGNFTIENSGTLRALALTGEAVAGSTGTHIIRLQSGSVTQGRFTLGAGNDSITIFTGADITNASFGTGSGADTVSLRGSGSNSLNVSRLTSSGSLTILDGGTWTFTREGFVLGSPFSGAINVSNGTLVAGGDISTASSLVLAASSTLTGTGTVPGASVAGTLHPGGNFRVSGNLSLASSSLYVVDVNPGTASLATVNGSAALAGGTINLRDLGGTYANDSRVAVLTAANGVDGVFGAVSVTGSFSGFTPTLVYEANTVYVQFLRNIAPQLPANASLNVRGMAASIDAASGAGAPAAFRALANQSGAALVETLNSMTGEIATQDVRATARGTDYFLSQMSAPASLRADGQTIWFSAYGSRDYAEGLAASGAHDAAIQSSGGTAGIDLVTQEDLVLGAAIGGSWNRYSVGMLGRGDADALQFGLYGKWTASWMEVSAAASTSHVNYSTDRSTTAGTSRFTARYDGSDVTGRIEAILHPGLIDLAGLSPYGALQYQHLTTERHNESTIAGPADFALDVDGREAGFLRSEIGFLLRREFEEFSLTGKIAWLHASDAGLATHMRFLALPAAGFDVTGASQDPNSALMNLGVRFGLPGDFSLVAAAGGEIASRSSAYGGRLTVQKSL